ncbi:MAG: aldo/keto reductase [Eubacteriales bacterium]
MRKIVLGRTNLQVTKTAFGALPLQRRSVDDAVEILRMAKDEGINFFDTARAYTDSEKKLGIAFMGCREDIIIATKTHASNLQEMKEHLKASLEMLQTSYIDIYQFHNVKNVPKENDDMYKYMLELKEQGVIRHIGATSHSYDSAVEVIECGLYETLQYPVFCLSDEKDLGIIQMCKEHNVGLIAMKGMGGGLIDDAKIAFSFLGRYDNVATIWGVQKKEELQEFIELDKNPPESDDTLNERISKYRTELGGEFCRGCGYCLSSCPVGIQINNCARMSQLLRRAVWQSFVDDEWQKNMKMIDECIECRKCTEKCPYSLDIPKLLKKNLEDYNQFIKSNGIL